jgi:hypothetical protein
VHVHRHWLSLIRTVGVTRLPFSGRRLLCTYPRHVGPCMHFSEGGRSSVAGRLGKPRCAEQVGGSFVFVSWENGIRCTKRVVPPRYTSNARVN